MPELSAPERWTNAEWVAALGADREHAWVELRARVVRGLTALLSRRPPADVDPAHVPALADELAQQTILAVKSGLDQFRGDSHLTTWVYRIAVNALLAELRRRRWSRRILTGIDGEPDLAVADNGANPERATSRRQLWTLVRRIVDDELTAHQRTILLALAFQATPLDVVAAEHGMSRDAGYKTLHDARRKLRAGLLGRGVSLRDFREAFGDR
jgi:RNA polymerase sigma-70 factor (ECF subfamily)